MGKALKTYRLFGYTVRASYDFATPLLEIGSRVGGRMESQVAGELIRLSLQTDRLPTPPVGEPVYATAHDTDPPALRVYETDAGHDLRFAEGLAVRCDAGRIEAVAPEAVARSWAEVRLLGPVIAFYLERSGLPVLHASAVRLGEHAIGFLAGNRAGKSSLAMALTADGGRLLTDDLLAVEAAGDGFVGRSGYPQMRFWPDAAAHWFGDRWEALPRVHPSLDKRRAPVERFAPEALPLHRLYLPERSEGVAEVRIEPLRPRHALVELIGRSFIPRLAAAAGWEAHRFRALAELAETIPTARLVYPAGFDRLPEVAAAIRADLAGSAAGDGGVG